MQTRRSFERSDKLRTRAGAVLASVLSSALVASTVLAGEALRAGAETPTVEQDFLFHCAACHGADGKGDGPVARALKIQPPDLTLISRRNGGKFPEARIFETISGPGMPATHGTREMPVWGNLFIGEILEERVSVEDAQEAAADVTERIRRLVDYVATIQIVK